MKILIRDQNNKKWGLVETAKYHNESELQHLLAESPGLITISEVRENASPLVLAVREFSLPIGSIDILAFSDSGDIAIVECKLAASPEIKRKVIGQVLEYGAFLWQISYEDLDQGIRLRTGESLVELIEKVCSSPDWDEERFRKNVETSLEIGNFILIIVVDEINDELTRIVRYMNITGNKGFDFAALEMRRYKNQNTEMLIPRLFGPSRSAILTKVNEKGQWDELSFFSELQKNNSEEVVVVTKKILDWAKEKTSVWWGKGKQIGSFVPNIYHKEKQHQLFAIYTYGVIETYFQWYGYKSPFDIEEKRIELLNRLNSIQGVNLPTNSIVKRPSIRLEILTKDNKIDQFLEIYDWFIEEVMKS